MCVRKKSLQQRWQAPFKLNCLNLKFIICKLLSRLTSCYMERAWKKCQVFFFWMKCSDVSLSLSCFCLGPVGLRKVTSFSEICPSNLFFNSILLPTDIFSFLDLSEQLYSCYWTYFKQQNRHIYNTQCLQIEVPVWECLHITDLICGAKWVMMVSIGYTNHLILFVGLRQFRVSSAVVLLACTGQSRFWLTVLSMFRSSPTARSVG